MFPVTIRTSYPRFIFLFFLIKTDIWGNFFLKKGDNSLKVLLIHVNCSHMAFSFKPQHSSDQKQKHDGVAIDKNAT